MSRLRTPALIVALVAAVLIVVVETGSSLDAWAGLFRGLGDRVAEIGGKISSLVTGEAPDDGEASGGVEGFGDLEALLSADAEDLPGMAVASLVFIDLLLMVTLLLFTLPLVVSPRWIAMSQGCVSLILGLIVLLLALLTILKAVIQLFLMMGLLLAIPFGTIAYMVLYADFDTTKAAAILSLLMFLKCVLAIAVLIAHERFLINLGFVALVATSFVAMIIISFLHNFPPTFLIAITDVVAALVVCIVAIIWAVVYLVGGVLGLLSTLKGCLLSLLTEAPQKLLRALMALGRWWRLPWTLAWRLAVALKRKIFR